ncbi:site-specific integrase [Serratia ureilytica]|uniref:tyrosine-type recombinase/integrase n=1 Tax=Serratia ureilytica TaxID=300181 RepID=UPI0018D837E8|nr:site-specific integrase [Serratia ureilytica]MBH3156827.1 site-specific integrase [Serratia ureilytica]MBH3251939.1 site-specific integrase [Serratia ureilytica]
MSEQERMHDEWELLLDEYFFTKFLRPATEWSYRKVVLTLYRFMGEGVTPAMLTQKDVLQWRRHLLKEKGLSVHTWNNKVAHLRAIFNLGMKKGLVQHEENPFNGTVVRPGFKKKRVLNRSQLTRIYLLMQQFELREKERKCVKGGRCALYPTWFWTTVLDTFRFTGMRNNQLVHIRLADINLEQNSIELRLEGSKTHREWKVPVVSLLRERIKVLLTRATERGAGPNDLLFDVNRFTCPKGMQYVYDEKSVHQSFRSFYRRLSRECGFDVSSHRFRHTFATELMKSPDRNIKLAKDMLGHRSVSTTMEYINMDLDVAGQVLEEELALYTDLGVKKKKTRS